jgi:hypothetical protein
MYPFFFVSVLETHPVGGYWLGPVAKFLVPDWGDKVDSGIGLSFRSARLHRLAGRYNNPMPKSTKSSSQGLRIWPLSGGN